MYGRRSSWFLSHSMRSSSTAQLSNRRVWKRIGLSRDGTAKSISVERKENIEGTHRVTMAIVQQVWLRANNSGSGRAGCGRENCRRCE